MEVPPPASGEVVLSAAGLHKLYARRPHAARARLRAVVARALTGRRAPEIGALGRHEFWALNDVSFDLRRGEALGVIGLNGSGKTTLLRILAGQILPDRGEVRVQGSTAAMIDLQAGFQPAASGRENVFLRAAALGFSRAETAARLDGIIAFSELGDAIDAPMASYSAGMKMRLAFSVMAMVEPDVLFIDEVLGVGDFLFRQKCLAKIREMRARSGFVLVTHSMNVVSRFCDRAIVLRKGEIAFEGAPDDAVEFYKALSAGNAEAGAAQPPILPRTLHRPEVVDKVTAEWIGPDGEPCGGVREGDAFGVRVSFDLNFTPRKLIVGVPIYDAQNELVSGFASDTSSVTIDAEKGMRVTVEFHAPETCLNAGNYKAAVGITDGAEFLYTDYAPDLTIRESGSQKWGRVTIPHSCRYTVERPDRGRLPPEGADAEATGQTESG